MTPAERARASRASQRLPETVTDLTALRRVAALLVETAAQQAQPARAAA